MGTKCEQVAESAKKAKQRLLETAQKNYGYIQSQNVDLKDLTNKIIEDGKLDPLLVNNLMDTEKMVFMLPHCGECVEEGYPSNTVGSILRVTNLINWQILMLTRRATLTESQLRDINRWQPTVKMLIKAKMFQFATNLSVRLHLDNLKNGQSLTRQWRMKSLKEKGEFLKDILTHQYDVEVIDPPTIPVNISTGDYFEWAMLKFIKLQTLFDERKELELNWSLFSGGISTSSSTVNKISHCWPVLACIKIHTFGESNSQILGLVDQIENILRKGMNPKTNWEQEQEPFKVPIQSYGVRKFYEAFHHFTQKGSVVEPGTKDLPAAPVGGF